MALPRRGFVGRRPASRSDDYNTPPEVLEVVRRLGHIALDPCSNEFSQVGARMVCDVDTDGLGADWALATDPAWGGGLVFVNPPFSQLSAWVEKCITEAQRGCEIILLAPAGLDTKWWGRVVETAQAAAIWRGRVRFYFCGERHATPMQPTAFAYWGPRAVAFCRAFAERAWPIHRDGWAPHQPADRPVLP